MALMSQSLNSHYSLLLGIQSPWKVANVNLEMEGKRVVIDVSHGPGKVACPDCGKLSPQRDLAPARSWRHLDTMNFETIIQASVPRCNCPDCGVKTVAIPWAGKHSRFTLMFEAFAIEVLRMAGSLEAGRLFLGLSWDSAHAIMKRAVERGLVKRDISEVEHIGIDEKSFLKGHNYLTALNDLDGGRVLDVVQERTEAACCELIRKALPSEWCRFKIDAVAVDMWPAFANSIRALLPNASIVYDRYHVSSYLGGAVDQVRRAEHKQLLKEGDDILTGSRYSVLRSAATRTAKHESVLDEICGRNLKTSRAWAIKESFVNFWEARNRAFAEGIFRDWYSWAIRSQLKPVMKVAKMLKKHLEGLLTYFEYPITNAVSEGLNSKIQSVKASARGFRNFANYRIRILFTCGKLDLSPDLVH
jgi:transposase